jgi:type II secretory pathway predicted ATPase ExeA
LRRHNVEEQPFPKYSPNMHTAYFVIGASGSGKTSAVRELESASQLGLKTFFFDSIGVPSEQERIERWGSGGGWQRAMTIEWVNRMRRELANSNVMSDGQTRPSFIAEACEMNEVGCYKLILIHCSDDVRRARLLQRGQPELANDQMMEWARYLVIETTKAGGEIINNDDLSIAGTTAALAAIVDGHELVRRTE